MVDFNMLYLTRLVYATTEYQIHFYCPVCGHPNMWNRFYFDKTITISPLPDTNTLVAFKIPVHKDKETNVNCAGGNQNIRLYVAIHKDADGTAICISASAISASWWLT